MFAQALARTARIYGARTAAVSEAGRLTWRDLAGRIGSVAAGLRELGLQPGDRVAVVAGNSPEHLVMMYAVAWAGFVHVPRNTRLTMAEMKQIAEEAEISAIAADGANRDALAALSGAAAKSPILIDLDGGTGQ